MEETLEQTNPALSEGFERQLPENCVECLLFLVDEPKIDRRKQLSRLEELRKSAVKLVKDLAPEYIWQRDEFRLEVRNDKALSYLHGVTDYGDSVEDEWLIVYILRQLTLSHPNLWVRVFDGDGEFLLVEAANVLPPWLNPEMDRNRAWIHRGKLYIIPLDDGSTASNKTISLEEALTFIETRPKSMVQSDLIESEAFYRLEKYPSQIENSLHRTLLTIPRKLAFLLHQRPKAISPAVEAFYLRDALSLKPILSSTSTLRLAPTDFVTVSVIFTRVLFAQLRSQRFEPPLRWAEALNKPAYAQDAIAKSRLELGMKLTCGFEMMLSNLNKTKSRVAQEAGIIVEDLEEDGDDALPTDQDIKNWKDSGREDDETWMDINFEDFERELEGRGRRNQEASAGESSGEGFGDATTQADLRKLVSRFESFLNDESAGLEGAEVDEMDVADDETDSDEDSEDEDKAVSFDEEAFSRMMREMMGFPGNPAAQAKPERSTTTDKASEAPQVQSLDEEDEGIRQLASQFEAELNQHGALKLDPNPKKTSTAIKNEAEKSSKSKGKEKATTTADDDEESDDDGEVDIDYNLAKNLLESFKSQGGMAGPTGNILGMMGMQLPRDEEDENNEETKPKT